MDLTTIGFGAIIEYRDTSDVGKVSKYFHVSFDIEDWNKQGVWSILINGAKYPLVPNSIVAITLTNIPIYLTGKSKGMILN